MGEDNHQKTPPKDGQSAKLTPLQLLIIAGLLEGVLEVDALAISKKLTVEIVLKGSLKGYTELEKLMAGIDVSKISFKK